MEGQGKKSTDFGLATVSKNRTLIPEIRQRYETVIGRDGSYDFSDGNLEDRIIEIGCSLMTDHVGNFRYKMRKIAQWLYNFGAKGCLVFSDEPDVFYRGRIQNQIDLEQVATFGEFTLQFRCEPVAYAVEKAFDAYDMESPTIMYRDLEPDDVFEWGIDFPVPLTEPIRLNNYGTILVKPIIKMAGVVIQSGVSEIQVTLQHPIDDGSGYTQSSTLKIDVSPDTLINWTGSFTLDIDFENFYVFKGATQNVLRKVSGVWGYLGVGDENYLSFSGIESIGYLKVDYRARFI